LAKPLNENYREVAQHTQMFEGVSVTYWLYRLR